MSNEDESLNQCMKHATIDNDRNLPYKKRKYHKANNDNNENENENENESSSYSNKNTIIVIMAGGLGKRMNSEIPKVLHMLHGIPLIIHVVKVALSLNPHKILIVVGKFYGMIKESVEAYIDSGIINENIEFVLQDTPLGTGHAIMCCNPYFEEEEEEEINRIVVLSGDVPLITVETIDDLIYATCDYGANVLTAYIENPIGSGYGRVIISNDEIIKIIEEKDCIMENEKYKDTRLINCGIYVFCKDLLLDHIHTLHNNNSQNEYYLTQLFENIRANYMIVQDIRETLGINTQEELQACRET